MNWIKFVENHNSEIRVARIGRSVYSHASNLETSNTLQNWLRKTNKDISN